MSDEWIVEPIDRTVIRGSFDCGVPDLNEYLQRYARQNHEKRVARTFVLLPNGGERRAFGYYNTCMSTIAYEALPEAQRKGIPNPIPAMLIGRFAVDKSLQGRGLGEMLLFDALGRAVRASNEVGIFAVRVDAFSESAKQFYLKYGFIECLDVKPIDSESAFSSTLFLPISTLLKTRP